MHGERDAAEEGDNEEMELWCEGSEEGLLEEDLDVSLGAGGDVHSGKSLTSLCSCLSDGLLSVPAWVIGGLLFTPAQRLHKRLCSCLGEGLGLFVQLHATRHQASLPDDAFDPPSHGAAKA